MHLRVTETAEASLAEAVAEASNKATVVVLRYMAWQRYHFHWAKHNGSGEFIIIPLRLSFSISSSTEKNSFGYTYINYQPLKIKKVSPGCAYFKED